MSAKVFDSAKVYDFSTGREMVGIKKTNRKTFHIMEDGSMTSYFNTTPKVANRIKNRGKKFLNYFFDLED